MAEGKNWKHIGRKAWFVADNGSETEGVIDPDTIDQIRSVGEFARQMGKVPKLGSQKDDGTIIAGDVFIEHQLGGEE
jgi:hypothetical protein